MHYQFFCLKIENVFDKFYNFKKFFQVVYKTMHKAKNKNFFKKCHTNFGEISYTSVKKKLRFKFVKNAKNYLKFYGDIAIIIK